MSANQGDDLHGKPCEQTVRILGAHQKQLELAPLGGEEMTHSDRKSVVRRSFFRLEFQAQSDLLNGGTHSSAPVACFRAGLVLLVAHNTFPRPTMPQAHLAVFAIVLLCVFFRKESSFSSISK